MKLLSDILKEADFAVINKHKLVYFALPQLYLIRYLLSFINYFHWLITG